MRTVVARRTLLVAAGSLLLLLVLLTWLARWRMARRSITAAQPGPAALALAPLNQGMERTGGLAHDFNNVLSAIQIYASVLDDGLRAQVRDGRLDPAHREKMARDVDKIREVADRGATLVTELLAGQMGAAGPHVVDINQAVRDLEELVRDLVGSHITVRLGLDAEALPVLLESSGPGSVERVVMNLVINARDAMAAGGTLTIETDEVLIEPGGRAGLPLNDGAYVRLSVSDTGTGMSDDVRARAFEPFFTTKPSGPGVGQGCGLGLPTVLGITRAAGGTIEMSSGPDLGTVVRVFLPSARLRPRSSVAAARSGPAPSTELAASGSASEQNRSQLRAEPGS